MLGSRFDLAEALDAIAAARDLEVAAAAPEEMDERAASSECDADHGFSAESIGGLVDVGVEPIEFANSELFAEAPVECEARDMAEAPETFCQQLELEMVEVARNVHRLSRASFKCPVCDSAMEICEERRMSEFGALDVKLHRLVCDNCGMLTGRAFHPSFGYHALVR